MKAVGYEQSGGVEVLADLEISRSAPGPHDLLVAVKAISVNPVDTKVRAGMVPVGAAPKVLGYDAAGVVEVVGSDVSLFKVGDDV